MIGFSKLGTDTSSTDTHTVSSFSSSNALYPNASTGSQMEEDSWYMAF